MQITGDASGTTRQAGNSQSSRKALLPVTQVSKRALYTTKQRPLCHAADQPNSLIITAVAYQVTSEYL